MRQRIIAAIFLSLSIVIAHTAGAAPITLTFEGGPRDCEAVDNYYNGGSGNQGTGPGPDLGIVFLSTYAGVDDDVGGHCGNFGAEPSPDTTIWFQQGGQGAWMNVASGFTQGLSFYYSNPNGDNSIYIYSGTTGTGTLLATLFLPVTPWNGQPDPTGTLSPFSFVSVAFSGTARSVDFRQLAHRAYVDNLTLAATTVPGPAAAWLLGSALGIMGWLRRTARSRLRD